MVWLEPDEKLLKRMVFNNNLGSFVTILVILVFLVLLFFRDHINGTPSHYVLTFTVGQVILFSTMFLSFSYEKKYLKYRIGVDDQFLYVKDPTGNVAVFSVNKVFRTEDTLVLDKLAIPLRVKPSKHSPRLPLYTQEQMLLLSKLKKVKPIDAFSYRLKSGEPTAFLELILILGYPIFGIILLYMFISEKLL